MDDPLYLKTMDDIIYLAGYFDADGYVSLHANKGAKKKYPHASVSSKNPKSLELFVETFGGKIYKGRPETYLYIYRWIILGENAVAFLREILPYLIVKKKRAELVVEYAETAGTGRHISAMSPDTVRRLMEIDQEVSVYNAARTELAVA